MFLMLGETVLQIVVAIAPGLDWLICGTTGGTCEVSRITLVDGLAR